MFSRPMIPPSGDINNVGCRYMNHVFRIEVRHRDVKKKCNYCYVLPLLKLSQWISIAIIHSSMSLRCCWMPSTILLLQPFRICDTLIYFSWILVGVKILLTSESEVLLSARDLLLSAASVLYVFTLHFFSASVITLNGLHHHLSINSSVCSSRTCIYQGQNSSYCFCHTQNSISRAQSAWHSTCLINLTGSAH